MDPAAKVLIIDDEEAARYGIRRALESQGYLVEDASDGAQALARIESWTPDVIVSDINMPVLDGLALLERVNRGDDPPPVVLITAYGSEEVAVEALRRGAYDYLAKPFNVEALRAIVRNALERSRLTRENRAYQQRLEEMLARLKQSQAALVQAEKIGSLGKLVAGVAHEVNTPLGTLSSATDTIERASERIVEMIGRLSPETASSLASLVDVLRTTVTQSHAACERIAAIVQNLRSFAQLDRADYQRVQVHEGIESTLALLGHELDGIEVERAFGDLPEVDCSPRQLNQVFMNLLLNGIEAIRQSGRPGRLRVATAHSGDWIEIDVVDNGCGIAAGNLDKVFDPGFTTKGAHVGTGLGLPICYQIVHSHRGSIEVTSQPDEGTRFRIVLPTRRFL